MMRGTSGNGVRTALVVAVQRAEVFVARLMQGLPHWVGRQDAAAWRELLQGAGQVATVGGGAGGHGAAE